MKKRILAMLLICIFVFTACGNANNNISGNNNTPAPEVDGTAKYNAYIDLLNFVDGWFSGMLQSYFGIFGSDAEPSFDGDFTRMFEGFARVEMMNLHGRHHRSARNHATRAPDWGEADARMLDFADAVERLLELYFVEMTEYFYGGLYEEDNFRQAYEMHTRFFAYIDAMWDAYGAFLSAFTPVLIERQGADLPLFEEHGFVIHFYALRMLLIGIQLSWLENEPIAELEEYIRLFISDLSALEAANTPEQREFEGISEMAADHVNMYIMIAGELAAVLESALANGSRLAGTRFEYLFDSLISRYNTILSL